MNLLKQIMVVVSGIALFCIIAGCVLLGVTGFSSMSDSCADTVNAWARETTDVMRDLTESAKHGGDANFSLGQRYAMSAQDKFDNIPAPTCDQDAMEAHMNLKSIVKLTNESFIDIGNGDFNSAITKISTASRLMDDFPGQIGVLEQRYQK